MTSRAELLAKLEEKRQQNKTLDTSSQDLQISEPESAMVYNPYDNPGTHQETPDDGIIARHRTLLRSSRRR